MQIPASRLEAYTQALNAQQRAAFNFMQTSLRTFYELNGGAIDDETMREFALETFITCRREFGDAAASIACSAYDVTMDELGIDTSPAQIHNPVSVPKAQATVNYFVHNVTPDNFNAFAQAMAERAYNDVGCAANDTTIKNAERDYSKGARYARVPTGKETCGFCVMLASRGFDYKSRQSAGDMGFGFNRFHDRCDCRVVAGDEFTEVEGYDPDWLYSVYLDARKAVDPEQIRKDMRGEHADVVNKRITDSICNEINKRAKAWSWDNKAPAYEDNEYSPVTSQLAAHGFATSTTTKPGAPVRMNGLSWGVDDISGGGSVGESISSMRQARVDGGIATAGHYAMLVDDIDQARKDALEALAPGETAILIDPNRIDKDTGLTPMRRVTR